MTRDVAGKQYTRFPIPMYLLCYREDMMTPRLIESRLTSLR